MINSNPVVLRMIPVCFPTCGTIGKSGKKTVLPQTLATGT